MNFFSLSALINGVASTVIGMFLIGSAIRNKANSTIRSYLLMSLSIAAWSYSYFIWQISPDKESALFWCKMLSATVVFTPVFTFQFELSILNKRELFQRRLVSLGYILSGIFALLSFTPLIVKDVRPKMFFRFWPDAGPLYFLYHIVFFSYVLYGIFLMISHYHNLSSSVKNQTRYVLIALVLGFGGGATNIPLWYDIDIPPVGTILVAVHVCIIAYAIARYRLMDVTLAITRTGIFIAVYTLVLGLPFAAALSFKDLLVDYFGASWWIWPLSLMAVLATSGPFIYIYLERKAENRLLKEQRRYQDTLKQASVGMTRIRDLRRLLDLIAHIVTKTVRIAYAGIYLYDAETDQFLLQVSRDKGRVPIPKLTAHNPLITWINLKRESLVYEEIKRQMQDTNQEVFKLLEENMRALYASVVVPSFLEDRFMGFIVLGDKVSGKIYTREDLDVFQVLASQAALAIENAQFYDETKQMQEQVAQAEKMATIGTMADGLSHQINNRFYALSLIAGDTIDTIKTADTTKCSPEVKDMIDQVNHALDRIQTNVMQGGEVVRGILKYTRKGEEGLGALALDEVLDGTLEMVKYKIKLPEIDIVREYPKEIPAIKGNLVQLQEVFFNFIDNAYDAIVERRTTLEEEGYRGRISIFAAAREDNLEIIIEDNGMGIKDDCIKKVFTPFFTTKTSARRGTGLGLYVIRRVIVDLHKGKIGFESAYKVGTRFIVELPVAG
jgi:signal transduction histidine kinase